MDPRGPRCERTLGRCTDPGGWPSFLPPKPWGPGRNGKVVEDGPHRARLAWRTDPPNGCPCSHVRAAARNGQRTVFTSATCYHVTPPKRTKAPPPAFTRRPSRPALGSTAVLLEPTSVPGEGAFCTQRTPWGKGGVPPACLKAALWPAALGTRTRVEAVDAAPLPGFRALTLPGSPFPGSGCWARSVANSGLRLPPQSSCGLYPVGKTPDRQAKAVPVFQPAEDSPSGWEGRGAARPRARVSGLACGPGTGLVTTPGVSQ